jgi:D-aminopeptidase
MRARDHGVAIGGGTPGRWNAITDVAGVRVGHRTLIAGDGPLHVGRGPVRTGVTVILPPGEAWEQPLFAGAHRLNGNGELTGLEWIRESGMLTSPVALTNTHSVGVVRDALVAHEGPAAGRSRRRARGIGLDHRGDRHGRPAPPPPVPADRATRRAGHRADRRRRRAHEW